MVLNTIFAIFKGLKLFLNRNLKKINHTYNSMLKRQIKLKNKLTKQENPECETFCRTSVSFFESMAWKKGGRDSFILKRHDNSIKNMDLVWILIQANQCKIYILNNWGHFNILGIRWCQWFTVIFLGVIMACGYIRKWWHFLENEENDEIYFYFFCELITHALCPFFY